jgi:hypothetical protein
MVARVEIKQELAARGHLANVSVEIKKLLGFIGRRGTA